MGKQWKQWQTLFGGAPKSLQMVTSAMKLKDACSLKKSYDQPRQYMKKQRHCFANKGPSSQSYGFPVIMYIYVRVGLRRKLSVKELMLLNCGVGEDSWESLGLQEDLTVHPKGNQSWISMGRTDAEAETHILWPPHVKNWLTGKAPDKIKFYLQ